MVGLGVEKMSADKTTKGGNNDTTLLPGMVPTIRDDTMGGNETQSSAISKRKLIALTEEVERMSAVFEEANKAREEQRKMMDELHQDLLQLPQLNM